MTAAGVPQGPSERPPTPYHEAEAVRTMWGGPSREGPDLATLARRIFGDLIASERTIEVPTRPVVEDLESDDTGASAGMDVPGDPEQHDPEPGPTATATPGSGPGEPDPIEQEEARFEAVWARARGGGRPEVPDLSGSGVIGEHLVPYLATRMPDHPAALRTILAMQIGGMCLGDRVLMRPWGVRVGANLYLLIVGTSGSGKGLVQDVAEEIFSAVDPGRIIPGRFSGAGLGEYLLAHRYGLISVDEGEELLKRSGQDWASDTPGLLSRVYDGRAPLSLLRKPRDGKGSVEEPAPPPSNVFVAPSALVGIQPSALSAGTITSGLMLQGLLARVIVINLPRPAHRTALNVREDDDEVAQGPVVMGLRAMTQVSGRASLDGPASRYLAGWKRMIEGSEPDERLMGFWSRVPTLAVKFAMTLQVSRQAAMSWSGPPNPIAVEAMRDGAALASFAWDEYRRVFTDEVAFSKVEGDGQRVLKVLKKSGGNEVPKSTVTRALRDLNARQLGDILDTLVAGEWVARRVVEPEKGSKGGRPAELFTVVRAFEDEA